MRDGARAVYFGGLEHSEASATVSFDETEADDDAVDPGSAPVGIDANVLDRGDTRGGAVKRFLDLAETGRLTLRISQRVMAEIEKADHALEAASRRGLRDKVHRAPSRALTAAQHIARIRVRAIVCGNAKAGKHDADAAHLSEAAEAGCRYFMTYDSRLLRKRHDLETIAVPGLKILTIEEFLALLDRFDGDIGSQYDPFR